MPRSFGTVAPTGPSTPSPSDLPVAGSILGDSYRLVSLKGRGAIGEVWQAEHIGLGKAVAIKLLLPYRMTDERSRHRFMREGKLAAKVKHPNIVQVSDVGETEDGIPYLVMELLRGPSLEDLIQEHGALPWWRIRRILAQISAALQHAHSVGVVHRDLKPSNVMLATEPGTPDVCKIVDFGLAKQKLVSRQSMELTIEGQLMGSPGYMSPEQFRGDSVDARTDIYSLGCIAFHLLTGHKPFEGQTLEELVYKHVFDERPRLNAKQLDPKTREALEAVLHRAMHRHPQRRFPSVEAFASAIRSAGLPAGFGLDNDDPTPRTSTKTSVRIQAPPITQTKPRNRLWSTHEVLTQWGEGTDLMVFAKPAHNAMLVTMRGRVPREALPMFIGGLKAAFKSGTRLHTFWDLGDLDHHDPNLRDLGIKSLVKYHSQVATTHVLFKPGLMSVTISAAAMMLRRQIKSHRDRMSLSRALDAVKRGEVGS